MDRKNRITKALDEIAKERSKKRKEENRRSYVIYTSPEDLKILGEASRSHLNREDLVCKYRRIRKR